MKHRSSALLHYAIMCCGLLGLWETVRPVGVANLQAAPPSPSRTARADELHLTYSIQAPNREAAMRELIRWTAEQKGFLLALNDTSLSLRLPAKITQEQIEAKILSQGVLVNRSISRDDRGGRLAELDVQIRVKEGHLHDLRKLTADAGLSQTLALEQEINRVQTELDALKGERRYIIETTRTVQIQVSFAFTTHAPSAGEPGFGWAGLLGIPEFFGGFGE